MTHEWQVTVRGYELDSFGHLNNAVYLNYFEQARWEIFKRKNLIDYFLKSRSVLAVVEVNVRYMREAKVFDELVVKTELSREKPFLIFTQTIYNTKSNEKVARGTVKAVLLDEERVPHDIPEEFMRDDFRYEEPQ